MLLLTINSILFVIDNFSDNAVIKTSSYNLESSNTTEVLKIEKKVLIEKISNKKKTIYAKIDSVLLSDYSFSKRWIRNIKTDTTYTKKIRVPSYLPLYKYNQLFKKILNSFNIKIINVNEIELSNSLVINCKTMNKFFKIIIRLDNSIKSKIKLSPKFIIIIDDFGNQWGPEYIQGFLEFPVPITLAIIPGHWASKRTAEMAFEKGKEIIIHMPMEPLKGSIEKEMIKITVDMSEEEIRSNLIKAIKDIPHAKGLNNHEGSLGTADNDLMTKFFTIFKKYDLYFIDSITNSKSICEDIMHNQNDKRIKNKEKAIKFEKRDIFLDSDSDPDEIEKMFDIAVDSYINKGKDVVAIGHCRENTIKVLIKMVTEKYPELDYSFASEIVK